MTVDRYGPLVMDNIDLVYHCNSFVNILPKSLSLQTLTEFVCETEVASYDTLLPLSLLFLVLSFPPLYNHKFLPLTYDRDLFLHLSQQ